MKYFKKTYTNTSSTDIKAGNYCYKECQWWELLEPGDKIIYLTYFLRTGKQAVHTVKEVTASGVLTYRNERLVISRSELDNFCPLAQAKKLYPQEFI